MKDWRSDDNKNSEKNIAILLTFTFSLVVGFLHFIETNKPVENNHEIITGILFSLCAIVFIFSLFERFIELEILD